MMHQGNAGSEGLDGIAGAFFFCPYELQVRIHPRGESSWRQEFRVELTRSSPSSVFEPGHMSPGITWHSLYTLVLLSRAESHFCLHRLQEIRKIKLSLGPPGSPGQLGEPGVRLSTWTRAACSVLILRVLVPFSSATVAILRFWRLFQREENQWFKATKILEGLKKIFILSKAK